MQTGTELSTLSMGQSSESILVPKDHKRTVMCGKRLIHSENATFKCLLFGHMALVSFWVNRFSTQGCRHSLSQCCVSTVFRVIWMIFKQESSNSYQNLRCHAVRSMWVCAVSHRECGQFRPSLCLWKFLKIQVNFDSDGQLELMGPPMRSNPTARRGQNYLEFFKMFMNIRTELFTLSMGHSIVWFDHMSSKFHSWSTGYVLYAANCLFLGEVTRFGNHIKRQFCQRIRHCVCVNTVAKAQVWRLNARFEARAIRVADVHS